MCNSVERSIKQPSNDIKRKFTMSTLSSVDYYITWWIQETYLLMPDYIYL